MLKKSHLLLILAALAVALALIAVAAVTLNRHPAAPVNTAPLGEVGPASGPGEGLSRQPAHAKLASAARPQPAPSPVARSAQPLAPAAPAPASSAPPQSAAALSPAQKLEKSRDREALQMANRQLDALHLTDLQRQTAQDALDQLRTEWAAIQREKWNTAFAEALNRKIADFRRQGLADDKIVELIRPEIAAEVDRKNAQLDHLAATALQLHPSLTPDQIATLDARITIEQAAGGAVVKDFLTSDAYLKGVVQSVK